MPHLGVAMFHDQIGDKLGDERTTVIAARLRKQPVHQGKAASARRRKRFLIIKLFNWTAFTTGHSDPGAPAECLLRPAGLSQQGLVVSSLQAGRSWFRGAEIEAWNRLLTRRARCGFPS